MNKTIKIKNRSIGLDHSPFIIAEMSGNHNQSLEKALDIVDAAADAGATALKVQTYKPETMTLDLKSKEFLINDNNSPWYGYTLFDLYKVAMTPWEWHKPIKERCEKRGLLFFSSPFDSTAVDFLEELDVDFYKIASFENTDFALIKRVCETRKPIIISTGTASLSDISDIVSFTKSNGLEDLILLKCTSAYPAKAADANIKTIKHMRETFNVEVGLSDHTLGVGVAIASIAMGATVIEKHFTINRADGGVDSSFSLEPREFNLLVEECNRAKDSIGLATYSRPESEKGSNIFKRSLYICEDVNAGEYFTEKNIRSIRPGKGLSPKYKEVFIGKVAHRNLAKGTPVDWSILN